MEDAEYRVEVECPGCGRTMTVKSDRPVTIDWKFFTGYGRYSASVIYVCEESIELHDETVEDEIIAS